MEIWDYAGVLGMVVGIALAGLLTRRGKKPGRDAKSKRGE